MYSKIKLSKGFTPLETTTQKSAEHLLTPNFRRRKSLTGFTLLEILLVIGIIAILAGIVIVAINPSKQLATVRNTQRKSDIREVDNAVIQFYIDHGYFPASTTFPTSLTEICDTGASSSPSGVDCGSLLDLSELVPSYLVAIPKDPQGPVLTFLDKIITPAYAATGGTGYDIMKDTNNHIVLNAERAELGQTIAIGTSTGGGGETPLGITGLIAHYKMNDSDGTTVLDSTTNHYDGSGTYMHVLGKVGSGALSFNGSSEYITNSLLYPGNNSYTVSFWVKLASLSDGMIEILGNWSVYQGCEWIDVNNDPGHPTIRYVGCVNPSPANIYSPEITAGPLVLYYLGV